MESSSDVVIESDSGKGRAFLIAYEENDYSEIAKTLGDKLSSQTRVILVKIASVTDDNWVSLSDQLRAVLTKCGVRQASFVGFASAASVIMNLALLELKLVRTLVLIDASTRPHPRLIDRIADRIERFLPLGLPLRSSGRGFDAKSFLQRLRCPVLVVATSRANNFLYSQAEVFRRGLPSGWVVKLNSQNEAEELTKEVLDFQQIPAKCPQKNVA